MCAGGSLLLAIDNNNLVSAIIILVEASIYKGVPVRLATPR